MPNISHYQFLIDWPDVMELFQVRPSFLKLNIWDMCSKFLQARRRRSSPPTNSVKALHGNNYAY